MAGGGLLILVIHVGIMLLLAKLFRLDIFTCAVASLANIGEDRDGSDTRRDVQQCAGCVGIIMALLGYVVSAPAADCSPRR